MFQVFWTFTVAPEHATAFERVYGPAGPWVALFRTSAGYLGSELFRSTTDPSEYLTIDRWVSRAAYAAAQRGYAEAYARLDAECAAFTVNERRLGTIGD